MKTTFAKKMLLTIALTIGQHCFSQGFVNNDFEEASVMIISPGVVEASSALPGWTPFPGNVGYDTVSLGGAAVILEDANTPYGSHPFPIQGNYSVLLQGSIPAAATAASIGQTVTIPIAAQSLTFFGNNGGLQVTFNGQNIPYTAIGNGANYTIYGADISSYAGMPGQFLFTAPVSTSTLLDNVQFSSSSVPEPSALALGAFGALFLSFRRWRNVSH